MNYKKIYSVFSFTTAIFVALNAQAAYLCGKAAQGEILFGQAPKIKEVILNQQTHKVSPEGFFLIAFGRDDKPEQKITFLSPDNLKYNYDLTIKSTKWDVQNLKGVPPRKVNPSNSDLKAIEEETTTIRKAQQHNTDSTFWQTGFIMPVEGRISGNFGGQRIMNGFKKNPHGGMDIAVPEGTEIKASADGIISLAAPNLFYSGNVIIIDHGQGLQTIYAHLQEIKVKQGDEVNQGQVIALSGMTGRATGPHLHWGGVLRGTRFNPQSLLNIGKDDNFCFNL